MRRIEVVDGVRGIAIIVMLLFHSNYYWDNDLTIEEYNQYLQNPVALIALLFGKFAGIFGLISGLVYTYRAIGKIEEENQKISSVSGSILIAGFWVIIMAKIQSIFFNHTVVGDVVTPYPTGPKYYTMITGSIERGTFVLPKSYLMLYRSTALFMIGMSIIWTGFMIRILFNNGGHKKYKRNYLIIGILGTSIIGITSILKEILRPIWINQIVNQHYLNGFVLGIFVGDPFPFFPFIGYTMYGMIFGIIFYQEPSLKITNFITLSIASCYFGGGIYLLIIRKYDISQVFETPEQQIIYIQTAMMLYICALIYYFDKCKESRFYRFLTSTSLKLYGTMTLTIFMIEPLIGAILKVFIRFLFPSLFQNPVGAFTFGISLIYVWYVLLKKWQDYNYVGSFEWLTSKAINQYTKIPSRTMRIEPEKG